MKRNIDINEISDGKRYGLNDLVKADCADCSGCSACCRGMGNTIVLDPWDLFQLCRGTNKTPNELLEGCLELRVVDGVILPNLKLTGAQESCPFLNAEGRCSIHPYRPGICRLFPLGRIYENRQVFYFLQTAECEKKTRGKIKVKKWLGVAEAKQYERFVADWHFLVVDVQEEMDHRQDDAFRKECNMLLLQMFYLLPYDTAGDFYSQFQTRYDRIRSSLVEKTEE